MQKQILITGGSGLVGKQLSKTLINKGYKVAWLSRVDSNKNTIIPEVKLYNWDIAKNYIDEAAITESDCIVHLAGAGIAEKRWTAKRKKEILDSRAQSAALLFSKLKNLNHRVKTFISTSGTDYYPSNPTDWQNEEDAPGTSFLSKVCIAWEDAVKPIANLGIRTVINRIGLVLSKNGGALSEMAKPIKFGLGTYLGNGKQYYSWVHINDLCRLILFEIENEEIDGVFNAVSPNPITNYNITLAIARAMKKHIIPIPTPKIALNIALGEMAETVLGSHKVASNKIEATGFTFEYPNLETALREIYK